MDPSEEMPRCVTAWLGQVDYPRALALQRRLVELRRQDAVDDHLLLVEHPPVITKGSSARDEHILAGPRERRRLGLEIFEAGRGGDVTYHGPGQLVGYPVLRLREGERDAHRYLRRLEEVLLGVLGDWGIEGRRDERYTGVWVGEEKIAAIGVRLSRWITSHGFALNVDCDLSHFATIVPCGISSRGVTSMQRRLGEAPDGEELRRSVRVHFARVFGRRLDELPPEELLARVEGVEPASRS